MPRKALRCVLQLNLRLITCPGVLLKDKQELCLGVFLFGQYKKTRCVPAEFPVFLQEKLVFEKAFADTVDPGHLVELLEIDTVILELIQLIPPAGKVLATYEENTRDFLFPNPKFTRGHHGVDREIVMKRFSSFPGIAPKLRFSTSSIITEILLNSGRSHIQGHSSRRPSARHGKVQTKSPKKKSVSPEKSRADSARKSYELPTIASKSRSPSPYTKRRMCELSEAARQRLACFNLGPHEFRRETDKPPFVIRRVEQPSPGNKIHIWCPMQERTTEVWTKVDHDSSLLSSYRPKKTKSKSTRRKDLNSSVRREDAISDPHRRQLPSASSPEHLEPPAVQRHSQSSVLNRASLRERFSSGWPSANGYEILRRVKNILRTHSARQRLMFDESNSSKEDWTKPRQSLAKSPTFLNELQASSPVQQKSSIQWDNGEYRPRRAAVYKDKPHRAMLEQSLGKTYRNMHQKVYGAVSDY